MSYKVIDGQPPEGYKLIEENQLVGDGVGWAWFRSLYENENGDRASIRTSKSIWMQDHRRLGKSCPSNEELFEKYKSTEQ